MILDTSAQTAQVSPMDANYWEALTQLADTYESPMTFADVEELVEKVVSLEAENSWLRYDILAYKDELMNRHCRCGEVA